jgi:hypothetical protein
MISVIIGASPNKIGYNYSPSELGVKGQVSRPYEITGKTNLYDDITFVSPK